MSYPLGDEHVVDLALTAIADALLTSLQTRASGLRHPQLLRILWSESVGEADQLFESIAAFHQWTRDQGGSDRYYLLHVHPTYRQQYKLEEQLTARRRMAAVWNNDRILLIGAVIHPTHQQMIDFISGSPNLTADDIANHFTGTVGKDYIRSQLTNLALERVVARVRRIPGFPEVLGRNRWHYVQLWRSESSNPQ